MGIKCQMLTTRYVAKVRDQLLAPDYKPRRFLRHFASRAILYDFFIASGQDRARRFMGAVAFIRCHETDAVITMPAFVPKLVCTPYHFDIKRNRQGYWIARDRGGLAGGTFLTRKAVEGNRKIRKFFLKGARITVPPWPAIAAWSRKPTPSCAQSER